MRIPAIRFGTVYRAPQLDGQDIKPEAFPAIRDYACSEDVKSGVVQLDAAGKMPRGAVLGEVNGKIFILTHTDCRTVLAKALAENNYPGLAERVLNEDDFSLDKIKIDLPPELVLKCLERQVQQASNTPEIHFNNIAALIRPSVMVAWGFNHRSFCQDFRRSFSRLHGQKDG